MNISNEQINSNCKTPTDYKVHKPEVHSDRIANSGSLRSLDLKEVDIVDILVDSHFDCRTDFLGIVVVTDKDHWVHCCTGRKIES